MKKIQALCLLSIVLLFSSCGDFKDVSFSGINNVKIKKVSREGIEAQITARINNPNHVAFKIYNSDMDVTLNGIRCGKARLTNNVRIKPNSEEAYTFDVKSDLSNVNLADLPKILSLAMSKSITVALKGDLKVGKLFYKRKYPVEMSRTVPLSGFGL